VDGVPPPLNRTLAVKMTSSYTTRREVAEINMADALAEIEAKSGRQAPRKRSD
jgi:hypothetical protein